MGLSFVWTPFLHACHAFSVTTTLASSSTPSTISTSTTALFDTYVRCGKCQSVFEMTENDFGSRNGRRLECSVCTHSWFQSKDKLLKLNEGFEMVPLPERDMERIQNNMQKGLSPKFMGDFKLYIGNIAFECHEDDLYEVFGRVGEVGEVSLVRDDEGRNRGFGFITMRTKEDGEKAIEELNGAPVRGRNIAVRESNN
ncbi:hypothetical protein FisN_28Hh106 [Fistulifera solaris]|uniref:RRM domain-containing protein n=1 Tax=Fistulifera solaris TaxID=1519565 RepID=A0A1Z5KHB9_FISSO|nr:hypothetical protein FisN_28Hh106 [Fistulifera solaris]|eukprot:GAX25626.1 hypothetical protein FisN_28Hh106 [Fistulifera solaris]